MEAHGQCSRYTHHATTICFTVSNTISRTVKRCPRHAFTAGRESTARGAHSRQYHTASLTDRPSPHDGWREPMSAGSMYRRDYIYPDFQKVGHKAGIQHQQVYLAWPRRYTYIFNQHCVSNTSRYRTLQCTCLNQLLPIVVLLNSALRKCPLPILSLWASFTGHFQDYNT